MKFPPTSVCVTFSWLEQLESVPGPAEDMYDISLYTSHNIFSLKWVEGPGQGREEWFQHQGAMYAHDSRYMYSEDEDIVRSRKKLC